MSEEAGCNFSFYFEPRALVCFACNWTFECLSHQDPGEHGRQHHRALLQRRHLHPQHRELCGRLQDHADGDLTARRPTRRALQVETRTVTAGWLKNLRGCYWLVHKLTDSIGDGPLVDAPRSTSTHLIPLWHCYTMKQVGTFCDGKGHQIKKVDIIGCVFYELVIFTCTCPPWFILCKILMLIFCTVPCFCQITHQECGSPDVHTVCSCSLN